MAAAPPARWKSDSPAPRQINYALPAARAAMATTALRLVNAQMAPRATPTAVPAPVSRHGLGLPATTSPPQAATL